MEQPTRELSYGEKAVGLTFNPSNDPKVQKIKELYANVIDILVDILKDEPTYGVQGDANMRVYSEKGQLIMQAIREAQTAQMWAVKAITYQF